MDNTIVESELRNSSKMKFVFFSSLLLKKAFPDESDAPIDYDEAAAVAAAAALPEADVPPPEDDAHRRPITLYRHWVR